MHRDDTSVLDQQSNGSDLIMILDDKQAALRAQLFSKLAEVVCREEIERTCIIALHRGVIDADKIIQMLPLGIGRDAHLHFKKPAQRLSKLAIVRCPNFVRSPAQVNGNCGAFGEWIVFKFGMRSIISEMRHKTVIGEKRVKARKDAYDPFRSPYLREFLPGL